MKKKVVKQALTWILSSAMIFSMSSAIPTMTAHIYASEQLTGEDIPLTKIAFSQDEQSINVGEIIALPTVTYTPEDTTDSRDLTWTAETNDFIVKDQKEAPDKDDYIKIYQENNQSVKFVDKDGNRAESYLVFSGVIEGTDDYKYSIWLFAQKTAVAICGVRPSSSDGHIDEGNFVINAVPANSTIGGIKPDLIASEDIIVNDANNSINYLRISGTDRYDTAAAVVTEALNTYRCYAGETAANYTPDTAILVSGENYADALAADGLAGAIGEKTGGFVPVIMTKKDQLPASTAKLLKNFETSLKTIYVVGGENSVSDEVIADIKENYNTVSIERLAGADRSATAATVYATMSGKDNTNYGTTAIVVSGETSADAISASSVCYSYGYPLFLAHNGVLDEQTAGTLRDGGFDTVLIPDTLKTIIGMWNDSVEVDTLASDI